MAAKATKNLDEKVLFFRVFHALEDVVNFHIRG